MSKRGARAPRTGSDLGTPNYSLPVRHRGVGGESIFAGFVFILILIWWAVKLVALWIFAVALIAVLGALLNNNAPTGHDIAWTIIGFVALIVL